MKTRDDSCDSRWKAVVVTALVLLVGSVLPSPFQRRPAFRRFGPDKFLHLLGHACLAVSLAEAFATDRLSVVRAGVVAVGGSFIHGLVTGFLQRYVPGRVPERADLIAGLLGSVAGVFGWWYLSEPRAPSSSQEQDQNTSTENA